MSATLCSSVKPFIYFCSLASKADIEVSFLVKGWRGGGKKWEKGLINEIQP